MKHLYCAVCADSDEIDSFSAIVWSCCCWAPGHGHCPVASSRLSDQRQRRPDDRKYWAGNVVRSGDFEWLTVNDVKLLIFFGCLIFVGWKPILYWLFGPKNQSFRNKSGKTQPIRTKFGTRGQVKGWQRSGNFGRYRLIFVKMGAGTSPAGPEFFCLVNHATFW